MLCSLVCLPLRLCPDPRRYPATRTRLWRGSRRTRSPRWIPHLMKPLQVTAELEVEALRDILRDLVQLCHHLVHDVNTGTHGQNAWFFAYSTPT